MENWIIQTLAALVAMEFVYIFWLETVRTASEKTARTFHMDKEALRRPEVAAAMKNQGVYNLGIAVLVLCATFMPSGKAALMALMGYIILVAAYGSLTVDRWIILKQGGLAMLTLLACLLA